MWNLNNSVSRIFVDIQQMTKYSAPAQYNKWKWNASVTEVYLKNEDSHTWMCHHPHVLITIGHAIHTKV